ncbi:MAG TPA: extracellular solute-binding protein [Lachnospiraceae bacterium]|nr:extracellular solute-binding protein [Lachnospiraceae bacterium]
MKKIVKRVIVSLIAVTMLMLLGACGNKKDTQETTNLSKNFVYSAEELQFDFNMNELNNVFLANDRIYMWGVHYNYSEGGYEDGEIGLYNTTEDSQNIVEENVINTEEASEVITEDSVDAVSEEDLKRLQEMPAPSGNYVQYYVSSFDIDGSNKKTVDLSIGENSSINNYFIDSLGNIYVILSENFEDNSDPNNYIWVENYYLVKLNTEGEEQWKVDLETYSKPDADYFYVNSALCNEKNQVVMLTTSGIFIFDTEGKLVTNFDLGIDCNSMYLLKDYSLLISTYGEKGEFYQKVDATTGKLETEQYTLPTTSYNNRMSTGFGFDFFISNSSSIYGYNLGDTELKEIVNFIDSDFGFSYLNNIIGLSDTELIGQYYDDTDGMSHLAKLTKVDPSEVKDKKMITMACYYMDNDVRKNVINFNKSNDTYRIRISDYSIYDTNDDYGAGVSKLNADIVSGKVPDIIILNDSLPIKSYASKGLFEDLNTFIEKDKEINREDYLENIFDAYSTNGKLYQLATSFSAFTVVGKTADVGKETGWTLDDLNVLMASKPEGVEVFSDTVRSTILNNCIQMTNKQYINWETGECSFNSKSFTDLLEFIKQFPEEYDYSRYDDPNYYNNYQTMYRDGRALLSMINLSQFNDYNYTKQGSFGEDITMIGYPTANKDGSAIMANMRMAMSAKSKNKDGIWEYMRNFMLDEYQDSITYGFPISKSSLDALAQKAKEKPFYLDENGKKVEYEDSYWINDLQIPITPSSDEDIKTVMNFLSSLDQVYVYDEDLTNIIVEEAASYFSGQKSAADVAAIIQSRVQIYISENM